MSPCRPLVSLKLWRFPLHKLAKLKYYCMIYLHTATLDVLLSSTKHRLKVKLSWTNRRHSAKLKGWTLTLLLKKNASYFDTIYVWGYILICMMQIFKKICFGSKYFFKLYILTLTLFFFSKVHDNFAQERFHVIFFICMRPIKKK